MYKLQSTKQNASDYEIDEKEILATKLLSSLLLQSLISKYVTKGVIYSLVFNQFIDEDDITDMLHNKYSDKRDWEWYSEDIHEINIDDESIFEINDILNLSLDKLLNIIGIDKNYLYLNNKI